MGLFLCLKKKQTFSIGIIVEQSINKLCSTLSLLAYIVNIFNKFLLVVVIVDDVSQTDVHLV